MARRLTTDELVTWVNRGRLRRKVIFSLRLGQQTLSSLALELHAPAPSVSRCLSELDHKGLIIRPTGPARRGGLIGLSAAGHRVVGEFARRNPLRLPGSTPRSDAQCPRCQHGLDIHQVVVGAAEQVEMYCKLCFSVGRGYAGCHAGASTLAL